MNATYLLSLGEGMGFPPAHLFRPAPTNRWRFLSRVKPPEISPVQPALAMFPVADARSETVGRAASIEVWVLKLMIGLSAAMLMLYAAGAQHVAYTRQVAKMSQQLRQREAELRSVTQAYRLLQSRVVIPAASEAWTAPVVLKNTKPPARRNGGRL